MDPWRTAITDSERNQVKVRGYDLSELMSKVSFADMVVLLHRGELPTPAERRLIDAILIAIADHGPGSPSAMAARTIATGNRHAVEAAIAGGLLAIGDAHAGAGYDCMLIIGEGLERARNESLPIEAVAEHIVAETRAAHQRLPGLGHRFHDQDPRTVRLFQMARELGLARQGVAFLEALADATRKQIKDLPINVDGAIAATLYDLGFPPLMARTLFMVGRVAGLSAEVMEEYSRERPMRVRVPVVYDGVPPRNLEGKGN